MPLCLGEQCSCRPNIPQVYVCVCVHSLFLLARRSHIRIARFSFSFFRSAEVVSNPIRTIRIINKISEPTEKSGVYLYISDNTPCRAVPSSRSNLRCLDIPLASDIPRIRSEKINDRKFTYLYCLYNRAQRYYFESRGLFFSFCVRFLSHICSYFQRYVL